MVRVVDGYECVLHGCLHEPVPYKTRLSKGNRPEMGQTRPVIYRTVPARRTRSVQ
ncbi:hypothetical protein BN903_256 [Halorubrum sp. AJ67]|nr:hypothetical protein BN903_256 [Halorubrum sp. AJ67]